MRAGDFSIKRSKDKITLQAALAAAAADPPGVTLAN
jgi:hypothetical protein